MKFILLLATAALVSAKSLDLKQLEYGFCGELEVNFSQKLIMVR